MLVLLSLSALAADYTDEGAWRADAVDVDVFDYDDLALGATVTSQYFGYFYDGNDVVIDGTGRSQDGFILQGGAEIRIDLLQPAHAVGVRVPDGVVIDALDAQGRVVASTANLGAPGVQTFAGLVAPTRFTTVRLRDWSDGYADVQIDALLIGREPPTLDIAGTCPSALVADIAGFPPHAGVWVVLSDAPGSSTVPAGFCAGTQLGLSSQNRRVLPLQWTDSNGNLHWEGSLHPDRCGMFVQVMDGTFCTLTNVEQL